MSFWSAAASFAGAALPFLGMAGSSYGAYQGTKLTNETNYKIHQESQAFNAQQAKINRKFQEQMVQDQQRYDARMSRTAVRRRMRDLRKAGINPILAGKFDARSPSSAVLPGSAASSPQPPQMQNAIGNAIGTAMDSVDIITRRQIADTQEKQTEANVRKIAQEISNLKAAKLLTEQQRLVAAEEVLRVKSDIRLKIAQARKTHADAGGS